jgi:hypothetical protein
MSVIDLSTDRILTTEEVIILLQEDAKTEDKAFRRIKRCWMELIESKSFVHETPFNYVRAEKKGAYYHFVCTQPKKELIWEFPNFLDFAFKQAPSKSGLSMQEQEELVERMEHCDPIQVLLDSGYILDLVVPDRILFL